VVVVFTLTSFFSIFESTFFFYLEQAENVIGTSLEVFPKKGVLIPQFKSMVPVWKFSSPKKVF